MFLAVPSRLVPQHPPATQRLNHPPHTLNLLLFHPCMEPTQPQHLCSPQHHSMPQSHIVLPHSARLFMPKNSRGQRETP